jgi:hypothetical protein
MPDELVRIAAKLTALLPARATAHIFVLHSFCARICMCMACEQMRADLQLTLQLNLDRCRDFSPPSALFFVFRAS